MSPVRDGSTMFVALAFKLEVRGWGRGTTWCVFETMVRCWLHWGVMIGGMARGLWLGVWFGGIAAAVQANPPQVFSVLGSKVKASKKVEATPTLVKARICSIPPCLGAPPYF